LEEVFHLESGRILGNDWVVRHDHRYFQVQAQSVTPFADYGISIGITYLQMQDNTSTGGEGGIRTPDTLSGMPVFKTGAINHSATSPATTVLLQVRMSSRGDRP
jgi:hypothetical protein